MNSMGSSIVKICLCCVSSIQLIKAAKELVPKLESKHITLSEKVGIRAQLYNQTTNKLEDDFLLLNGQSSTHILNAISPAFTASFEFADLIINLSNF